MSSSRSATTEEWVLDMLAGFRFHPSEEQMVNLLKKKMKGNEGSQASHFMPKIDCETWDLPGDQSVISLFVLFMKKMMQGKDSQACHIIPEVDVCNYEPWDLPERMFPDSPYQAREWFSFSRPDYKSIDSPRCKRITKQGFWKSQGKPRGIKSQQLSKSLTCKKRTLTFYEGRVPKSHKTGWVFHQYYFINTDPGSNPNQRPVFVLCRLKNKSANKQLKDSSICGEFADPGTGGHMASNSEDVLAAANHMIPEAEEHLAYKDLEHTLLGSGNLDDGEPGGCVSSDFDDQALDDMIQELNVLQGKYPNSPFPLPEPTQMGNAPDIYNNKLVDPGTGGPIASISHTQAAASNHMISNLEELLAYKELEHALFGSFNHDYGEPAGCVSSDMIQQWQLCSQLGKDPNSSFPPPEPPQLHQPTQLGNVPDVYTVEGSDWASPIGDNDSYLTSKTMSTNYGSKPVSDIAYNFQNRATDERIPEVYSQPEENLGSHFVPFQQQNYSLYSLGDLLHTNNYIGCNESQSQYPEIATLFPQSS